MIDEPSSRSRAASTIESYHILIREKSHPAARDATFCVVASPILWGGVGDLFPFHILDLLACQLLVQKVLSLEVSRPFYITQFILEKSYLLDSVWLPVLLALLPVPLPTLPFSTVPSYPLLTLVIPLSLPAP